MPELSIIVLFATLAATAAHSAPAGMPADDTPCAVAAAAHEDGTEIPTALLQAIALTESGRWHGPDRAITAWPWTVTAGGPGRFFPTREAAISHVRALRARGVRNIDVGCLQVNLKYHPRAFATLEDAFDPERNAAYAARFLLRLKRQTRSLSGAVARYHSGDYKRGRKYWLKVMAQWEKSRRAIYRAKRLAVIARARARRAASIAARKAARH